MVNPTTSTVIPGSPVARPGARRFRAFRHWSGRAVGAKGEVMTEIHLTERPEQTTAVLRERVPMGELPDFFQRAFHATMAAMQAQGVHPVGPPIGKYYGMPTDTVDVEAGFPASAAIADSDGVTDGVTAGTLPGGRVVEAVHVGPFDTMQQTYDELRAWVGSQGLVPSDVMWETYLSDPEKEPDPATWRTQISWPVAE